MRYVIMNRVNEKLNNIDVCVSVLVYHLTLVEVTG